MRRLDWNSRSLITVGGFVTWCLVLSPSLIGHAKHQGPKHTVDATQILNRTPFVETDTEVGSGARFYTDVFVPLSGESTQIDKRSWINRLWLHNPGSSPANVQFFLFKLNEPNRTPLLYNDSLGAVESRRYDRPAEILFGETDPCVIRILSDHEIIVRSSLEPAAQRLLSQGSGPQAVEVQPVTRPSSKDPGNKLRQIYAALPANFAIGMGQKLRLLSMSESAMPLLVETTGEPASVRVTATDESGSTIASKDYALEGFEPRQWSVGDSVSSSGKIAVDMEVLSGPGRVIAFGSTVIPEDTNRARADKNKHLEASPGQDQMSSPLHKAVSSAVTSGADKVMQGGTLSGSGQAGQLALWTDGKTLGSSGLAQDSSGRMGVGGLDQSTRFSVYASGQDALQGVSPDGIAVHGTTNSGEGLVGISSAEGTGVRGRSMSGPGVKGESDSGRGIHGKSTSGVAVYGESESGRGIEGHSVEQTGVVGFSEQGHGVSGESSMTFGVLGRAIGSAIAGVAGRADAGTSSDAVVGSALGTGRGVYGKSTSSDGVFGESETGRGVYGKGTSVDGVFGESMSFTGVHGKSGGSGDGVFGESASGAAVHGKSSGSGDGVFGESASGTALHGKSSGSGSGLFGESTSGIGVRGSSTTGRGIEGRSTSADGVYGESQSGVGVEGISTSLTGVRGESTSATGVLGTSKTGAGVFGVSDGDVGVHGMSKGSADGVLGEAMGGGSGVSGKHTTGTGVKGESMSFRGVQGISKSNVGVEGKADTGRGMQGVSVGEIGVAGFSTSGFGVQGQSVSSNGVEGVSTSGRGVEGQSDSRGGVAGFSNSGIGVGGISVSGDGVFGMAADVSGVAAGRFSGRLIAAIKLFQIDHPLAPASKYLNHSSVESSEMKNLYDGLVILDKNGEAVVTLPDWFQALNTDFRYQLTPVDAPGPNLYIADKVAGNRFKIAGGAPGMEVSWQVTGIRQDAWAKAHPLEVEQSKTEKEQGTYLNPELFGQPTEKSVLWVTHPDLMERLEQMKRRNAAPVGRPQL